MITSALTIIFSKKSAVKHLNSNFLLGIPGRNNTPNMDTATLVSGQPSIEENVQTAALCTLQINSLT
ncbi:hypothetical protein [cyanobacterium endosymbiont of Rhopalodia gibberula]|uniref:hypothetical protein n=1 Tax=cyanobacterium endosymbiont of Rhopalodia gibberula TaxID=1763363 RepID=UPI0011AB6817|nr:hypothetical protein [cyanobacterium endosymbiont of Rhopalodia gibberula]